MSINLWNTPINKIQLGSTEINKSYLGNNLIYDNTIPPNWLLNNLVSYYKMDTNGSFPDSHWSNNGSIFWSTFIASAVINWGYNWDWINDYITTPMSAPWTWDFSFQCWIRTTTTNARVALSSQQAWQWYFSLINNSNWTVSFRITDSWTVNAISNVINDWSWHHVVWTRSWNTIRIYTDWVLRDTQTKSWNITWSTLYWGNFSTLVGSVYYQWDEDEWAFWNRELSLSDVQALYNSWAWLSYDDFTT